MHRLACTANTPPVSISIKPHPAKDHCSSTPRYSLALPRPYNHCVEEAAERAYWRGAGDSFCDDITRYTLVAGYALGAVCSLPLAVTSQVLNWCIQDFNAPPIFYVSGKHEEVATDDPKYILLSVDMLSLMNAGGLLSASKRQKALSDWVQQHQPDLLCLTDMALEAFEEFKAHNNFRHYYFVQGDPTFGSSTAIAVASNIPIVSERYYPVEYSPFGSQHGLVVFETDRQLVCFTKLSGSLNGSQQFQAICECIHQLQQEKKKPALLMGNFQSYRECEELPEHAHTLFTNVNEWTRRNYFCNQVTCSQKREEHVDHAFLFPVNETKLSYDFAVLSAQGHDHGKTAISSHRGLSVKMSHSLC